jgi:glycosyltransferase involved in cell wall biosynthesis
VARSPARIARPRPAVPLTALPSSKARPGGAFAIRVLLDYRPALHGRGGISVYTRELARAYAAAWPDDTLILWDHRFRASARRHLAVPPGARLAAGRLPSRVQEASARLGFGVDRWVGGVDVVHGTDFVNLPVGPHGLPVVVTLHDVLFDELPGCYTPAMRRGLRTATRRLVRRATRLIVPSPRVRDALLAHHAVDPDTIDVVGHGVTGLPAGEPAREYGRGYVLSVGTLEPRKNLARLLEAHARLDARVRLVVVGARGWLDDALVTDLRTRPRVHWEGAVDDARLAALYRGAGVLAYPSLGEGFGLPVLEAMALGLPVVVGADTACADLAGDAGLAVDPRDVDALAAALQRILDDEALARALGERGRVRAAEHTWARAARATRRTYERAVGA